MTDATAAERYVAGRMGESEAAEFEALMMEREDVAADVAVRQRIKLGLATLEGRGELEPLLKRVSTSPVNRRYAMAAAALLLVAAAGVYFTQTRLGDGISGLPILASRDAARELRVLSSHLLAQTRSDAPPPRIAVAEGEGLLQLQLLMDAATDAKVNVVLSTGPDDQPTLLGSVVASRAGDGMVEIWLRTAQLNAGVYRLTVTPAAGKGAVQSFEFEIWPGRK